MPATTQDESKQYTNANQVYFRIDARTPSDPESPAKFMVSKDGLTYEDAPELVVDDTNTEWVHFEVKHGYQLAHNTRLTVEITPPSTPEDEPAALLYTSGGFAMNVLDCIPDSTPDSSIEPVRVRAWADDLSDVLNDVPAELTIYNGAQPHPFPPQVTGTDGGRRVDGVERIAERDYPKVVLEPNAAGASISFKPHEGYITVKHDGYVSIHSQYPINTYLGQGVTMRFCIRLPKVGDQVELPITKVTRQDGCVVYGRDPVFRVQRTTTRDGG